MLYECFSLFFVNRAHKHGAYSYILNDGLRIIACAGVFLTFAVLFCASSLVLVISKSGSDCNNAVEALKQRARPQ